MTGLLHKIERGLARHWAYRRAPLRLERPMATFSFDDVPSSAIEYGADLLEARSARGTYFVCGSLERARYRDLPHFSASELKDLSARGHEIGCHGFEHEAYPGMGADAMSDSIARNATFLSNTLGDFKPQSFAYPFGDLNFAIKRTASALFPVLRGVKRGVNAGSLDLSELSANPLDLRWQEKVDNNRLIERAKAQTGWLIFFTHDVQNAPTPEGCTPDHLERAIDAVLAAGFDIVSIREGAARAGVL